MVGRPELRPQQQMITGKVKIASSLFSSKIFNEARPEKRTPPESLDRSNLSQIQRDHSILGVSTATRQLQLDASDLDLYETLDRATSVKNGASYTTPDRRPSNAAATFAAFPSPASGAAAKRIAQTAKGYSYDIQGAAQNEAASLLQRVDQDDGESSFDSDS